MAVSDLRIIQHLRRDARMNLTTISKHTGIPVSTIFDRVRSRESSAIRRFTALMDFARLGFPIRAQLLLRVDPASRAALRSYLLEHEQVNCLLRVNNGFDFLADCIFRTIKDAEEFVETIEHRHHILDKQVLHVIDELAQEKALMTMNVD